MAQPEAVHSPNAPTAVGPYSQAVRAGGYVFTAGQVGVDPANGTPADDVTGQAERALKNLQAILEAAGVDRGRSTSKLTPSQA